MHFCRASRPESFSAVSAFAKKDLYEIAVEIATDAHCHSFVSMSVPPVEAISGELGECDSAAGGKGREEEEWRDRDRELSLIHI